MSVCPYCGASVIDGDDNCPECQISLVNLHLAEPATAVERSLLADRVTSLHPHPIQTVNQETPVGDVLKLMGEKRFGCVLVVSEDGRLVGIFSERDALMKLGADVESRSHRRVADFMTESPDTLPETAKVAFAVQRMDLGGYRHLPIVNDGVPTAIISVRDILKYVTSKLD